MGRRRLFRADKTPPAHLGPGLFTPESLKRAWRYVKDNAGAPGTDGVSIAAFERDLDAHLAGLQEELQGGKYRPRAVLRVLVPKVKGGLRPLALWALRDRVAQRAVYEVLEPFFEPTFLPCNFGFRPGLGVKEAVEAVLAHRQAGCRWVADADIQDCFDSIDARLLMRFVRQRVRDRRVLRLLQAWLDARILNTVSGRPAAAGAAQGGVLSPLFCNVYLHPFDQALTRQGYRLVRFADDLVVQCRRKREASRALQVVEQALQPLKLQLNPHKTRLAHFDEGFKFLGVFFLRNEHFYL